MKEKIIGILMVLGIMLGIILGIMFSNTTYAGTGKLYTNLGALNPSGIGYGIGDPTNKGKYIWHMSTYDSSSGGLSSKQKNIYCLKAEYGASWESFHNSSKILEYNMFFDLQRERQDLLDKIVDNENNADEMIQSLLDVNGNQYRKILWLLDNMYINGENNKEDYLAKAGIVKDEYEGVVEYYNINTGKTYGEEELTDADIIAIQRVAIWTITNGGEYDKTENKNWLRITTDASTYNLLSDSREAMAVDLYNYLISSAKTGADLYTEENNYTINDAPIEVNVDGLTLEDGKYKINAEIDDSNYIIGPIVIDKNNDFLYKINMTVTNEGYNPIGYSFANSNGISLENATLNDFIGKAEGFYIKVDKSLATKVNVQIQVIHYNTTKNLWLQGTETEDEIRLNAEQPIAEFSREEKTVTMNFISGPEFVEVPVTKVWNDSNNQDGIRPNSITVQLLANGTAVEGKTLTLNAENNWTATFSNLPKKENGTIINYTVKESVVPTNYTSAKKGNMGSGFTITNTHVPEVINIPVTKVWVDNDNQEGIRPSSITVQLLANGTAVEGKTLTLNSENNWTATFSNLPKKENGKVINYTIEESIVPEKYISVETGDMTSGFKITNTHYTQKTFDLALRKYITKLNNVELPAQEARKPNIDEKTLQTGSTATYKHRKDPVEVKIGDIVTYSITIYNEGEKAGHATQIIDQLPTGLKYKSGATVTTNKNTYTVAYDEKTNRIIFNIVDSKENAIQELQPYKTGTLDKETIEIQCEVTANASKEKDQILTNVAWINEAYDAEDGKNITTEVGDDRDSEPKTIPNVNKDNMQNYKGNATNQDDLTKSSNYYKGEQDDDDFEKLIIPKEEKIFDLALRKYITQINNNELTKIGLGTRVPNISEKTLQSGTTATYNHRKDPVKVEENDIVTYAITIYNEGEKPGYASQIIDQLPEGLIYNSSSTITSKDANGADKNTYQVTYVSSTNKVTFDIVNTTENPAKELQPYEKKNLDRETIEIKCKVVYRAKAGESNILTNVAWINKAYDAEDNKIITTTVGDDRDSEPETKPNVDKDNMENYKGNKKNPADLSNSNYFYKGEQDDDDFEKIYVKTFDLSLRKFVESVNGKKLEISREPNVDVTPLQNKTGTTAIYNHPKTPVALKAGDTVIYTIRIYNEGEINGFASEVKDYLPPYLEYVKDSTINSKYGWNISEDGRIATTTYLSNKEISAFNGITLDFENIEIECKVSENAIPDERITNIAEISGYKYGDMVYPEDIDSKSDNIDKDLPEDKELPNYKKDEEKNKYVHGNEDDDDFEKVYVKEFDLSLRKFITQVQDREITSRIPQTKIENGVISYEHPKDALTVHVGETITYTLRIYNEGEIAGYASEITDDIPEYLEYLPEDSTNVEYMWKMYDENGNETEDVAKVVKVKTTYLSKENGENNLLAGFDGNTIYYKDIKIAFKVKDPNSNTIVITNHAQISDDTDEDGNEIKDKDSYPDKWNDGEDDQDIENIKVEYFDLSILKFVSKVIIQENGTEKITETGYNGHEDPEPVVKVELHKKKLKDVVVKFGYGITVTNEGDVPGYATEITDYVPEGLKFDSADNAKWIDEGNNVISTNQLENTLLQPGESKTIEVILTWVNDPNNMALKTNTVEISKDKNEYDVPDRDSTPDNKKDGEDDIDIAKVILAISTGAVKTYFTLTLGLLAIIATGVFLIKKFVI